MPATNKTAIAKRPLKLAPVKFDEAILATRARGVVLPDVYYGHMQGIARADSFSVAGIARVEQLRQVLDSLTQAQANGETFDAWKARVRRGEVDLDLPDHRLDNIYRTNIQGAYARGRCRQHDVIAARRPWLLYSAVNDSRTRPAHAAMNGTLLHRDDPWWATHRPPNGYRCRCTVIAVSNAEAERRGAPKAPKVDETTGSPPAPDEGWDYDVCSDPRAGTKRATRRAKANASPKVAERLDRIDTTADANDPATWREITGSQRGSNPGGIYEAPDGSNHYVKFYENLDQARAETAAARLFERMGVQTLKPRFVEIDGRTAVSTQWVDSLTRTAATDLAPAHVDDLARAFNGSTIMGEWAPIGVDLEAVAIHPNGRLVIVGASGTLDEAAAKAIGRAALKRAAKQALAGMTIADIERDLLLSGMTKKAAKSMAATIDGRRLVLLDRYKVGQ